MKLRLAYLLAAAMTSLSLMFAPFTLAESSTESSGSSGSSTNEKETEVESEAQKEALRLRVEKQKTEFKIKLDAATQSRIKLKCKTAQATVKVGEDRFNANGPGRSKAYDELLEKLSKLIAKLKVKGIDTTKLEEEKSALTTKIAAYKVNVAAYKQAMTDLRKVDCVTDPEAFQAALTAARQKRDLLIQSVKDIRTYIVDTLKPTLKTIREQVAAKEESNGGEQ